MSGVLVLGQVFARLAAALVALGSAGFIAFSSVVGQGDPTRVAAQVVSGIGFLGAGVILREGTNVRGLNTAATLWRSSFGAAVLGVVTNIAMRSLTAVSWEAERVNGDV